MLELETLFITGLPENKVEMLDARVPCCLAFATRVEAEATFEHWLDTLARWKNAEATVTRGTETWMGACAGYELELSRRRIDVRVPVEPGAFLEFYETFWEPELWGRAVDRISVYRFQEAWMGLWRALRPLESSGFRFGSRTDIVLTENSVLAPHAYLFSPGRWSWVGGDGRYFRGVPELVAEVAVPGTHGDDAPPDGRRVNVLARAGVRHYWLVDPATPSLAVYRLEAGGYRLQRIYRPGDPFRPTFPEEIDVGLVAELLESKEDLDLGPIVAVGSGDEDPSDSRVPDRPLSLEHLWLLGHPLRRFEVLEDRVPCVVAFRDETKARANYESWVRQAAAREGTEAPARVGSSFEAGRFRLWRDGRRVYGDFRHPARTQHDLLETLSSPEIWR